MVSLLLTLLCVPGGLLSTPHAFASGTDGGFEIDGNTVSDGADDWLSVTGVSGPVMDNTPKVQTPR